MAPAPAAAAARARLTPRVVAGGRGAARIAEAGGLIEGDGEGVGAGVGVEVASAAGVATACAGTAAGFEGGVRVGTGVAGAGGGLLEQTPVGEGGELVLTEVQCQPSASPLPMVWLEAPRLEPVHAPPPREMNMSQ